MDFWIPLKMFAWKRRILHRTRRKADEAPQRSGLRIAVKTLRGQALQTGDYVEVTFTEVDVNAFLETRGHILLTETCAVAKRCNKVVICKCPAPIRHTYNYGFQELCTCLSAS